MQLAQVNLARVRAPLGDPMMAEFMANLDPINALAEATPGFVWRLVGEGNDATDVAYAGDPEIIVNLSVWQDAESLRVFTYRSHHTEFLKRRREWFSRMDIFVALWWVETGHRPTVQEARERLEHLAQHGPTPRAFTFARVFEPELQD